MKALKLHDLDGNVFVAVVAFAQLRGDGLCVVTTMGSPILLVVLETLEEVCNMLDAVTILDDEAEIAKRVAEARGRTAEEQAEKQQQRRKQMANMLAGMGSAARERSGGCEADPWPDPNRFPYARGRR